MKKELKPMSLSTRLMIGSGGIVELYSDLKALHNGSYTGRVRAPVFWHNFTVYGNLSMICGLALCLAGVISLLVVIFWPRQSPSGGNPL
jgi:hypothetical protein